MASAPAPLIPRAVIFGNPEKASPAISPDGTRMAYLAPANGVLNVWVGAIGSNDFKPVTGDTDRGIRDYHWAANNRDILYLQDKGGDENWRLYGVDLESGETRDFTPFDGVQAQVIEIDKHRPDSVLIGLNKDNPQLHDVYELHLRSGELEKVAENPGFIGWVVDSEFVVRCGVGPTPDGGFVIMVRDSADSQWRPLTQVGQEDSLTTGPVAFTLDGNAMVMLSSQGANAGRLVKVDAGTGEILDVIAEDPTYDVTGAMIHPDTREIQMATFLKARAEHVVIDPSIRADIDGIRSLHDGDFEITGRDHADTTWLVLFTTDDGPVAFYAWDRQAKKGTFLFESRPELNRYTMAKMEPFSFTARDGLTVHGYLTFPAGGDRSSLPTVLNVHGGPWHRDSWGFNPETQWFANRGYLSVQVNFRGSTGYGKQFINAGDREWGGKMHDDLIDAVEYVISQGYADRDRIAIYGGSYGGFAALVGATFTPDVFRCAVDIVGPSNLKSFIESIPPYWAPLIAQMTTRVGNPETEEDFLWSRSPLSKVDAIKIPMLIAQGANDPRVKQAESEQIVEVMKEKGIAHEYMLFPDEGHGFAKPENRIKFYAHAEKFLALNLGGRSEEASTDLD